MRTFVWNELDPEAKIRALARPRFRSDTKLQSDVRFIVERVREGGWDALVAESIRIDNSPPILEPVAPAAQRARRSLPEEQVEAIQLAADNISRFHRQTVPADLAVETMPGLQVRKVWRPIDRVGFYVPGGKTPLFSTLLMLAAPARAAGVSEIIVMNPPRPQGGLEPAIALAAELCGIDSIWTVGGAQAIAALAFGAGPILQVAKICGPGNAWVAEAKTFVASLPGGPAIDLPAGPSELMVIADDRADPGIVAADLLSQAEHDEAAQILLVTDSLRVAAAVASEIAERAPKLPRSRCVMGSVADARLILTASLDQAVEIANLYAPEHLSLAVRDPEPLLAEVRNAGAVFVGACAAETVGDYLGGSSHVLPTDGAARAWSGVSVQTFLKSISVQTLTPEAAARVARPAALLARLEGLEAHARAAEARAVGPGR